MDIIIGPQFRAARAFLGYSMESVAKANGMARATIKNLEDSVRPPRAHSETIRRLVTFYEDSSIEFLGGYEDNPGIRLLTGAERRKRRGP